MITRLVSPGLFLSLVFLISPHISTPLQPTSQSDVYIKNMLQQPGDPDPTPGPLHPIILIPGDGGSQIEARLNKTSSNHWWCSKVSAWYDLWLNIEEMLTLMVQCWSDNTKLSYNSTTRTTSNAEGTLPLVYISNSFVFFQLFDRIHSNNSFIKCG